ncbi:MAG: PEP-CTERM sorting domain-containing protein [Planctomycetota bacterium]
MNRITQLSFVVTTSALAPAAMAQVELDVFAQSGIAADFDASTVPMPGSDALSASALPPNSSFATATSEADITGNLITTSGSANAVSHPSSPEFGEAVANFTYNFSVATTSQLVFSYDFFSPGVGLFPDPNYDIRQTGISLVLDPNTNPIPIITDGLPTEAPFDQTASANSSVLLVAGDYQLNITAQTRVATLFGVLPAVTDPIPGSMTWDASFQLIDGQTQTTPFLPTGQAPNGGWIFSDVPQGGNWFDPVVADGFEFEMLSGSTFTEAQMPVGLDDGDGYVIEYLDGGSLITTVLAEGGSLAFPAGVSSFKVLDIDPAFDPDDPLAFPIFLDFSTTTASFSMTPILVPEPATLAVLTLGGVAMLRRRRDSLG